MSVKDPVCGIPLVPSKTLFTANFLSKQYLLESEYSLNGFIECVKIVFPDSLALFRASGRSPILRLSIETRDPKRLDELKDEMTKRIRSVNA